MKKLPAIVILLLLLIDHPAYAQSRQRLNSQLQCRGSNSIGNAIESYYRLISGPAGKRNWDEFDSLFLPTARLDAVGINERGENQFFPQSKGEYIRHVEAYVKEKGFFQKELKRTVRCYASIGQVFSSYESRNELRGKVIDRGVISFQLIYEQGKWKIAHVMWNSETKEYPVPGEYIR